MVNKGNLEMLFNDVMSGKELNISLLKKYGFSSKELKEVSDLVSQLTNRNSNNHNAGNKYALQNQSINSDEELIKIKHEELVNGKLVIMLPRMQEERIKRIKKIVKKYNDMRLFCIDKGNKKIPVLTYKLKIEERLNLKQIVKDGSLAYKNGQYDECISLYTKLIYFGYTKAFVYAKMGLSYLKKGNTQKAITYLTIADLQSKKENSVYDFSDLLSKLKGVEHKTQDEGNSKVYFKMPLKCFEDGFDNYGIQNFEEVADFIIESGVDVESACEQLLMNSEKINKIRLLLAREYYSNGNFEKGDQFLREVEKSKPKTKEIIRILEEIRINKRFYFSSEKEKTLKLTYLLEPSKRN